MWEEYKEIELEKQHLYFLRVLGRKVGVKSPTALKKIDLIKEIRKSINSNNFVENRPLRGRPCLAEMKITKLADEKISEIEKTKKERLKLIFEEYKKNIMKKTSLFLKEIENLINDL